MKTSSKRAQYLAITGIVLSVVGFITCFIFGAVAEILAVRFLAWQILGGALIWTYLAVLFRNKDLAEQEKLDEASMAKSAETTVFQDQQQRQLMFNVARKRLEAYGKWGTLVFSVVIAVYSIVVGVWLFRGASEAAYMTITYPLAAACAMVVIAFFSFLIARYATGMAVEAEWKPLKAGGSYLLAGSLLAFIISIGLAMRFFHITLVVNVMAWVVPIVMIVYGIETVLSTVLDVYRPRFEGQYHRLGFESRLFGMINEPGNILQTAASTIDYQFGFKVSQSWFYKLLENAIMPLLLFLIFCAYISSSIVVVGPGQQAVVERFGSTNGGQRILDAGLHIKMPWPIDIAQIHDTHRIQQISIGMEPEDFQMFDDDGNLIRKPLLWGEKHHETEYRLIVATETTQRELEGGGVPVSIIVAAIPVQFKVNNIHDFLYNHTDPKSTLRDISFREIGRYMASAKLETDVFYDDADTNRSVLGAGREAASRELKERIQRRADELALGVEIVLVGVEGIHPPLEVAADYERVVAAIQQRQKLILEALAERNKLLTEVGGSITRVSELYELVQQYQLEKDSLTEQQQQQMLARIDEGFENADGMIAKKLLEARRYAYERKEIARSVGERFANQMLAHAAAPDIYLQNQRLITLERMLADIRKYVVVSDEKDHEVIIIDLQESLAPSLYDIEMP